MYIGPSQRVSVVSVGQGSAVMIAVMYLYLKVLYSLNVRQGGAALSESKMDASTTTKSGALENLEMQSPSTPNTNAFQFKSRRLEIESVPSNSPRPSVDESVASMDGAQIKMLCLVYILILIFEKF